MTGRATQNALVAANTDAATLAQLVKGRLREKIPQSERALVVQFGSHEGFMVARQSAHIDFRDNAIEQVSQEMAERMGPVEAALERLDRRGDGGRDWHRLRHFPSAGHLASWAGLCPGNHESAGKSEAVGVMAVGIGFGTAAMLYFTRLMNWEASPE